MTVPIIKAANETGVPLPDGYVSGKYPRSAVKYVRVPLAEASKRGLESRALAMLVLDIGMAPGVYVAGGCIASMLAGANHLANDVDLFFNNPEAFEKTATLLMSKQWQADWGVRNEKLVLGDLLDRVPYVEFAKTMLDNILDRVPYVGFAETVEDGYTMAQAVKIDWFEDAEEVIDGFDFVACQAALDLGTLELVFNPLAVVDYSQRKLVLHRYEPKAHSGRVKKYENKGFVRHGEWPAA